MKIVILFLSLFLLLLAGCSSAPISPFKKETEARNKTLVHLTQKTEALDGEFESRFKKPNKDGSNLFAVGVSTGTLYDDEFTLLAQAEFKAKLSLVEAAPSEYKSIVQQKLGDSVGGAGTFDRSDISVTEVQALTGFRSESDDKDCKRFSEPTADGDYRYRKECRVIVRIPLNKLEAAFRYTLNKKYGIENK